jgi:cytoskeleton protein RodZ
MIGWKSQRKVAEIPNVVSQRGFDDYEIRLGDILRGERATLGKSLFDVQRELRVKASYIQAIENCDPSVFESPAFISGHVRSYAKYLHLDPDDTYAAFCAESGFSTAHGLSVSASASKRPDILVSDDEDMFAEPRSGFSVSEDSVWSRVEPAAIASSLVLLALIAGIGYGGWSVLREVQRVTLAPVDQPPVVLSDLDPVQLAGSFEDRQGTGVFTPPRTEAMDRLYRPQSLDVPVVIARDAPISTLDPDSVGSFASAETTLPAVQTPASGTAELDAVDLALAEIKAAQNLGAEAAKTQSGERTRTGPILYGDGARGVTIVAVRDAWVRVRTASGTTIFTQSMKAGDTYEVPTTEVPPIIRIGSLGAVYFAVDGVAYGPAGTDGQVANVTLDAERLVNRLDVADLTADNDLVKVLAELNSR